uniref:Glycosyltransferase group 1 n=1 Tax=uncultured bacterium F39-01 TaxID=1191434 RepID=I3VIE6_9BACT|nr:glycosyltransferase group 1 [uncultured bacterium F39-01]
MRVLYLVPSFYPAFYHGGPVISGYHLCNALSENGVELRVLTTDTAGPDRNLPITDFPTMMPARYPVYYCRRLFSVSVAPGILWRMVNMIRWADVVHLVAVYSFPTIPALLVCKLLNKPVVWSPRGSLQRWNRSSRVGLKSIWNCVCRLVAPRRLIIHSTSSEEEVASSEQFRLVEIVTVPNGVDVPSHQASRSSNEKLRLLYLGRLDPIKAIDNLIAACAKLNNGLRSRWSLTIAGTGETSYREKLSRKVADLSLTRQIKLVGEVKEAGREQLFDEADLLILPSHQESFGMAAAEAMARGLPVIVSTNTPWKQVDQVQCGMCVANDSDSLAEAIGKMHQQPLQEMGLKGREWMKREFSWKKRAVEMLEVYEKVQGL